MNAELCGLNALACEVLDIEANAVLKSKRVINSDFERAIDLIFETQGRVIVTGMGKSGLIGRKIAATFSSTGTPAYYLHPAESTHGDSGMITKNDIVLAISNSGETLELLNLLPYIKRLGVPIISMTGNLNSTLAKAGDVVIDISVEKEACPLNKAPTASTTVTLALGDALAMCLLKKRGFTEEDFLMYHPSGALGKSSTLHVRDLMKTSNLPIVTRDMLFTDVIKIISEYKLGMAIIAENNKLTGIMTDGDIRRTLLKYNDISNLKIEEVMTVSPKTVLADDFATKALHLMEKYSITTLAVVDNEQNISGIIHIHDLLKAGVI
ncbi:KpsF/GutQ family sugar-phosphate isomerase [bacterium]|nr:KpsF/GutQ family sugar-phosphate isomerase [bacterium]